MGLNLLSCLFLVLACFELASGRALLELSAPSNVVVTRSKLGSQATVSMTVNGVLDRSACPATFKVVATPIFPWSWSKSLNPCQGDRTPLKGQSAVPAVNITGMNPSMVYSYSAWYETTCDGKSAVKTYKEKVVYDNYLSTPRANSSRWAVDIKANAPSTFVWLTPAQKRRMKSLTSIFENAEINQDYTYAENLGDGRGITFGIIGFCTGTGDGLDVLLEYTRLKPENSLEKYIPRLTELNNTRTPENPVNDDVSGLDGFASAVRKASSDSLFRKAQDTIADKLVYKPSQRTAAYLKLKYALSKAQIYDAWVNHGFGDVEYLDSANALIDWTNDRLGGSPAQGIDEKLWLRTFLTRRWYVLAKKDKVWAESVGRVKMYQYLANANMWNLDTSIKVNYGCCGKTGVCGTNSISGLYYGDFSIA